MFIAESKLWLVCFHSRYVGSRRIPTWSQTLFTGTELECIKFFIQLDFKGINLREWFDVQEGCTVEEEIQERYKDFREDDFPLGYTIVPGGIKNIAELWKEGGLMYCMDEYVHPLE